MIGPLLPLEVAEKDLLAAIFQGGAEKAGAADVVVAGDVGLEAGEGLEGVVGVSGEEVAGAEGFVEGVGSGGLSRAASASRGSWGCGGTGEGDALAFIEAGDEAARAGASPFSVGCWVSLVAALTLDWT